MNTEELQKAYGGVVNALRKGPRNSYERVKEFMVRFGNPVFEEPTVIKDINWEYMRLELIREELCELYEACGYDPKQIREALVVKTGETDLVAAADALGDIEYVVNGAAIGMGIPLPEVVEEIHRSNMSKLARNGEAIYRMDGKILKGPDYVRPDLKKVLWPS